MAERVLLAEGGETTQAGRPDEGQVWRACALAGAALAVAGWTDVILVWLPLHFGNAEWEFGTVSTALDAMPLGTIGVALLVMAGLARGWRRRRMALGIFAVVVVVGLVISAVLYLLNVPMAWRGIGAAMQPALKKAFVKSGMLTLAYVLFYGGVARLTLKTPRRAGGGI